MFLYIYIHIIYCCAIDPVYSSTARVSVRCYDEQQHLRDRFTLVFFEGGRAASYFIVLCPLAIKFGVSE